MSSSSLIRSYGVVNIEPSNAARALTVYLSLCGRANDNTHASLTCPYRLLWRATTRFARGMLNNMNRHSEEGEDVSVAAAKYQYKAWRICEQHIFHRRVASEK